MKQAFRPVLEYASPVWHISLTADHALTLESVQQWACQIIVGDANTDNCALLRLETSYTVTKTVPTSHVQLLSLPAHSITSEARQRYYQ